MTIFGEEFLRLLELRCASSRVKLVLQPYQWDGSTQVAFRDHISRTASPLPSPKDVVGYAYVAPAIECGRDGVIQELTRDGKPVAALDEEGDWLPPINKPRDVGVRLFPMGVSLEPAREIGRYLLSLGHRSIAYLSPFHAALWSRRRAEGLADLLCTAGAGCTLRTWTLSACGGHEDFQESGEAQCGIARLRRSLQRWTSTVSPACAAFATPAFEDAIATISRQGEIERRMEPLFEEAWADRSISAWVMADDYVGAIALRFLRRRRIRVPEDLSVVSFDDTAVAVQNRLTSYNFNLSAIVNAMLGHLLGRGPDPPATGMPHTYIRGFVVERRTSGSPVRVASAKWK